MNQSSTNPHHDTALAALIESTLNGEADDAQFLELERRLRNDAAAREAYATYVNLHCELTERFAVEGDIVGLEAEFEREFLEGELADFRRTLSAKSLGHASRPSTLRQCIMLAMIAASLLAALFVWNEFASRDFAAQDALAQVRDLEGEVRIIGSDHTSMARIGDVLRPAQRLRTAERDARAVLEYADGTTVALYSDSVVQAPADGDVRLRLLSGSIEVDAAKQPADRPLVLATDHARYVVLGTRFRLYRDEAASRLELNEGEVRLEREENDRIVESIEVQAGQAAVASADTVPVEIMPLAAGRAHLRATFDFPGDHVIVAPSGEWLAVSDQSRGLRTLRLPDGLPLAEQRRDAGPSDGLAITDDERTIVQLNRGGFVQVWRLGESQAVKLPFTGENVRSRALSPDGRFAAHSSDSGIEVVRVNLRDKSLDSVAELPNLNGRTGKAWSLAFSRDGQRLAAGFWDGALRVYDVEAGDSIYEVQLADTVFPLAISGDGRWLAAHTNAGGLTIIDTVTREQQTLWSSSGARVVCLSFATDDGRLLAGFSDHTARVWSVDDGQPLLLIDIGHVPRGIAEYHDGRRLITVERSIKLWECQSLKSPAPSMRL